MFIRNYSIMTLIKLYTGLNRNSYIDCDFECLSRSKEKRKFNIKRIKPH